MSGRFTLNDYFANLTTTYTYDLNDNIIERNEYDFTTGALGTPTDTVAYTYNTTWRDQLASYDGQAITCDAIGNPLIYRGFTMTWQGKRLSTLSGNGTTASYTYNEQGVRTSKTVNSVVTNYNYNGSLLMAQVTGSGAGQIKQLYSYDAAVQLVSVNYNGMEYYYMPNGQNDIVGLMDSSGAVVVSYTYDSWGKSLTVSDTLATTLGANNPFRYRGYYYDTETGLYYLQTRYYDATVCRFISADAHMSTGQGIVGNNMYAYCGNNPVMRVDPSGQEWWHWAIAAAIVVACAAAVVITAGGAAPAIMAVAMVSNGLAAATTASTIAAGAFIGSSISLAGAAFLTAEASTSVSNFAQQGDWGTVGGTFLGAVTGGLSGYSISKSTQSSSGKGTQNAKVKAAVEKGKEQHSQMDYGPGTQKEYRIDAKNRVDAIDMTNNIIYELKPNNPRAIAKGMGQLARYTQAASNRFGGKWTGVLKLYK